MTVELVLLSRVAFRDADVVGRRLHDLLALLATELRAGCAADRLIDGVWAGELPEHPAKALQALVFRARAQLGPDVVVSTPRGYRLALAEEQVDASAVLRRLAEAEQASRAGDHPTALAAAERALALWAEDPPDVSGADGPLAELRAARIPTHRALTRARAMALARLGRRAEALDPLLALAAALPRDEEVLTELLRCEAAVRGPAAALARYDAYRRRLRDALGVDPGPALRAVHEELLRPEPRPVRHGVPHEPNPLLGRADDVAAVVDLMRTSRVTSIVGPGGLGKTRLAHAVARDAPQRTVFVVPLAGLTDDEDVAREVAAVLGAVPGAGEAAPGPAGRPVGLPDLPAGIVDSLGPDALLVLDNCEHVIRGAADLVGALVARSRDLRVLTTSRTPLGLSSEAVHLLPELSVRTSAELFRQRARAVRPDVDLPDDAVHEVCRHLDGLPLAVELAAARVKVLPVREIANRLDRRFALLRTASRDTPERHRTLAAVIDWSWHLLGTGGRAAMRTLSVFPGGFTADAAGAVLGDGDPLPVLEHLVDQSLLKVAETAAGVRFRMLATVRGFSAARRDEAGETAVATDRFLAWARGVGIANHTALFESDVVERARQIRAEHDNLSAAFRIGLERADGATVATTSAVLGGVWMLESNFSRIATLAGEPAWLLSHYRPEPALVEPTRTAVTVAALGALLIQGTRGLRSRATLRRLPPAPPTTPVAATDAVLRVSTAEEVLVLCESGQPMLAAIANGVRSYLEEAQGNVDTALVAAGRMLAALQGGDNRLVRVQAHARVGELSFTAGRIEDARHHLSAALPVLDELEARSTATRVRWAVAFAALHGGALDEAELQVEQLVRQSEGDTGLLMFDLVVRAEILTGRGDVEGGLHLWRLAAERLRSTTDRNVIGMDGWTAEVHAGCVIGHAFAGRLELVADAVDDLPRELTAAIDRARAAGDSIHGLSACGALLVALALADLARGGAAAAGSAARMVALAGRCSMFAGFQSATAVDRSCAVVEAADAAAYAAAVAEYADLDRDAVLRTASAVLDARLSAPELAGTATAPTGTRSG
ncbi:ATP-binding protein [Cryptosporangium aurantiacum]|uniref:ATP-binding protein n=1 Tax=Cryptosporangium aurantiacum TaxID=134849 RepID=UPI0009334AFE|nr:BTAD domain-containing putative transcriptional regulator [Cryptosporangium aurantiacum]